MYFSKIQSLLPSAAFTLCCLASANTLAEGSRTLYPESYPSNGARANLDLQPSNSYMERISRRGFTYVYAEVGEYILLGSSNRTTAGDILVYNPQDFGVPGDETIPAGVDFSCDTGTSETGTHYSGGTLGEITSRNEELAGPRSADSSVSAGANSWQPCAYQAPETGIYGVQFTVGSGDGPNGSIASTPSSDNSTAAWEVAVRSDNTSIVDLDGRVFTYAFVGFTGRNDRPVFTTLYYVTTDGYRYQQDLRGLDPNGYALYANTFGFLDHGEPLYKTLRGSNAHISNLPLGVSAQPAQYPIFFSDIGPLGDAQLEGERVLAELGIPLTPPSPQIDDISFEGIIGGTTTATGAGGTFSFNTTDTVSYEIVISRDGVDFDPATPTNRVLTGIAFSGLHQVIWNGLDNNLEPFPARAEPYSYAAYGRNGEVHFPIIDAENNGNPDDPDLPGGGPTITRLNGTDPNDTTVFFDDRGYVTQSGELVGTLNGELCGTATPAAAALVETLDEGVDSSGVYRQWEYGDNENEDCHIDAGWGDAKAVNLWTYFLTGEVVQELIIIESLVDVATSVTAPATADEGDTVQAVFTFGNNGTSTANNVAYTMNMSPGLGTVDFDNLPDGANAAYDNDTGVVTLTGFPPTLDPGENFTGMTASYTAPASGPVDIDTGITTSDPDDVPENNAAMASTAIGEVDVATDITGVAAEVAPGDTVTGSVAFSNNGTQDAHDVVYELTVGGPGNTVTDLVFTSLPAGVTADYDTDTGIVTLTGLPSTLPVGVVQSLSFSYTAPAEEDGAIEVTSTISTSDDDANPLNDNSDAQTLFAYTPDVAINVDSESICIQDAPYIRYTITPVNFTPNNLATIEFVGSDDSVVETLLDQPLTGQLLWPEAAVDLDGNGVSWPGWELDSGEWVQIPSVVRPELTVRISVNPTAEVVFSYPPPTIACNTNPPGQGVAPPSSGESFSSGSTGSSPVAVPTLPLPALWLTILGCVLLGRRHSFGG
ncbi:hypothetical protein EY643_00035 [Halioglobus maricola]|uniref:DUF11 domain-containing protein n=1 Tax=Halioglobus maricola TaxID=2601894 RepID=A0A5P9NG62_9GAMM|nr:DUF11 domain-containing protein [Halioglobus maricola]QFU74164.1 hypothetical protein EY643_00035 [Halioglobus maricola]